METPPIHVLLALDAQILGGRVDAEISTESTPTVTESSTGDEGSSPPPSPPPPGAPIKVRTVGGREAIVLEKMQRGWFRVELDGNANDEGGARERKSMRGRRSFAPGQDHLLDAVPQAKRPLPPATGSHVASTASAWVAVCKDLLEAAKDRAVSPPSAGELQLRRELEPLRRGNERLKTLNRPGWIGAYSPVARKRRIARFHGKRARRVWTKPPPRHRRAAPAAARSPNDS